MAEIPITRTRSISWSAAIWSGLIAGVAFLMLEMIMVPAFLGKSMWGPPRMIGAIVLGKGVLPPPATFDAGVVITALAVHLIFSIIFMLILAWIIYRMDFGAALGIGALFGLALYFINFYLLTGIFPWFAMARSWVSLFTHTVFGLVGAWAYMGLTNRATRQVVAT
ncbi:MAG: hypothetical protein ACR2M1_16305 [Gemmatimonadaceae bacterium]